MPIEPPDDSRPLGPWELPRSVLAPGKVITDPVHGDIHLNKLEVAVIDSRPFQRLRRIQERDASCLAPPGDGPWRVLPIPTDRRGSCPRGAVDNRRQTSAECGKGCGVPSPVEAISPQNRHFPPPSIHR